MFLSLATLIDYAVAEGGHPSSLCQSVSISSLSPVTTYLRVPAPTLKSDILPWIPGSFHWKAIFGAPRLGASCAHGWGAVPAASLSQGIGAEAS